MSIKSNVEELAEFCDMEELKEDFYRTKKHCNDSAAYIKQLKYSIKYLEDSLKSDQYRLASKGITIRPSGIFQRLAYSRDIRASKQLLKRRKLEFKVAKEEYKEYKRQRKDLHKKIKETYDKNKDSIQKGKEEKARKMGEKIRSVPNKFVESLKETVDNTVSTGKAFLDGLTANPKREIDGEER